MKKFILTSIVFVYTFSNILAQQEKGITGFENWLNPWTEFKPNKIEHGKPTQILSGNITKDKKLYKKDTYLLLGDVFVTDSTTLTIEPGTVIIGDFKTKASLTISKGSTIIAQGESTDPIIFTSSQSLKKPGDWGGLFILGNAPTNERLAILDYGLEATDSKNISYSGDNTESNSGILKYVLIEYAGKRTKQYGYFNGLTLAGVGNQTILENIMVSFCKGNSFNIIGGDLTLEKFVSYKSSINDYKISYGAQCSIINSLAVKSPYVSGSNKSRCLFIQNTDNDVVASSENQTVVKAENLTLINMSRDLETDISMGLVNEAIYVGKNTTFKIDKSVFSGFKPAVLLDNDITINDESLKKIIFTSNYFNNCTGNIFVENTSRNDDLENWYGSRVFNNVYSKGPDSETFIDTENSSRPDFRLRINQIVASKDD